MTAFRLRLVVCLVTIIAAAPSGIAFAVTGTPDQIGQWGSVLNWGVQGKHMTLLPNGSVLVWSTGDTARVGTRRLASSSLRLRRLATCIVPARPFSRTEEQPCLAVPRADRPSEPK